MHDMNNRIIERLGAIFTDTLQIEVPPVQVDLIDGGLLDSLKLVELILELERQFDLRIDIDSLDVDDFRSIARIADLVIGASPAVDSVGVAAPR